MAMYLALGTGLLVAGSAVAQTERGGLGLRAGVGTDITLGLAYGLEINYTKVAGPGALQLGVMGFGGRFSEDSEEGCCTYHEKTDLVVAAAIANYLFGYARPGPYFVFGLGVGVIGVDWREESPDDVSLGPFLPGGGSYQEADATAAGTIVNAGIGQRLSSRVDIRLQVPTFFLVSEAPGGASSVVPTLTVSLGYRF
jgi:hypothetical protein